MPNPNPYREYWVGAARGAAICAIIIVTLQLILFGTIYILRRHSETEPEHFRSLPAYAMKTWPCTLSFITAGGLAGLLSSISQGMLRFSGTFALITIPPGVVYAVKFGPMGFAPNSHAIALVAAAIGTSCALVLARFAARLKSNNKSGTMP